MSDVLWDAAGADRQPKQRVLRKQQLVLSDLFPSQTTRRPGRVETHDFEPRPGARLDAHSHALTADTRVNPWLRPALNFALTAEIEKPPGRTDQPRLEP